MDIQALALYYQKFLDPLLKWKILDTNSLMEDSYYQGSYVSFCEMLRNLKSKGLIHWTPLLNNKKRVIYLTSIAQKELLPKKPYFVNSEILFHDAIVSNVARSFMKNQFFYDCELPHEYFGKDSFTQKAIIDPDGILYGKNEKYFFKFALEIELTRKSKERICKKINEYIISEFFDSVMYIFDKSKIYHAFIKYLKEIRSSALNNRYQKNIDQKIYLILKEDLYRYPLDFSECTLFVNNKERKFSEVIYGF